MKTGKFEQEEWRPVVGFEESYEVSSKGRIRRIRASRGTRAGKIRRQGKTGTGYPSVSLYGVGCKRVSCMVHRLVVEAFLGPIPDGMAVNHKDGIKSNNSIENLEVVSYKENSRHALAMGLIRMGSRRSDTKLNEEQVKLIRTELYPKMTQERIAEMFGVSRRAIGYILKGRTYHHCAENQEAIDVVRAMRRNSANWTRRCERCKCYLQPSGQCTGCTRRGAL